MSGSFPSDAVELVQSTVTEGQVIQNVNFSDMEIAGIAALSGRFTDLSVDASMRSGDYSSLQMLSEQQAVVHSVVAQNAGDMNVYTAHTTASENRTSEAIQYSVLGTSSAAVASETRAQAASLEQRKDITVAQVQQEMRLHNVVKEEVKRDTAVAEADASTQVAAAEAEQRDAAVAVNPLKLV
ncbi:MAG: hypothetical protein KDI61_12500 [Alphaproteobacteria bacterium]|nr:hypothetical protein [Alphaproteobacteria bacterium]MCB1841063.1 hypothetical protein [Alphaproteobacteria bacterium]